MIASSCHYKLAFILKKKNVKLVFMVGLIFRSIYVV
jgi:hypothetical protein